MPPSVKLKDCGRQIQGACSFMEELNTAFLSSNPIQKPNASFFRFRLTESLSVSPGG